MGNDGGDIPGRRELVKDRKKIQHRNTQSIAIGRSRFCNLTHERLKIPLAICRLGYIYNYENVLEALVKKELPSKYKYIRNLSDIKKVEVEKAPEDSLNFIACPITKMEYNGANQFVALWSCGHVLSRKAFKQIKGEDKRCVFCEQEYVAEDLIDLNLQGEKLQRMRQDLLQRRKKKKEVEVQGAPGKKVKTEVYISPLDRLGGQFRDIIRERTNFKKLFFKEGEEEWKTNTYFAEKSNAKSDVESNVRPSGKLNDKSP